MQTIIPANPGAFLLNATGERIAVIVAWAYVQGNRVDPIFDIARSGPMKNEAIQHSLHSVVHPDSKEFFNTVADWNAYAAEHNLDRIATPKAAPAATGKPAAAAQASAPPANEAIKFGTKSYSTKSFWAWGDALAVFEIEAGQPYPHDPRVKKVKREEFFEFKRTGFAVIDPHVGLIEEAEATEAAPVEEDEDMDVV